MAYPWLERSLVEPARDLLESMAIGSHLQQLDDRRLCNGVEWLFCSEVEDQYPPWPSGSTTDGLAVYLCQRPTADSLVVVGMCFLDFTTDRFPLRAHIELTADRAALLSFSAEIGNVDPLTGAPPRLSTTSMILLSYDEDLAVPRPDLLVGRRTSGIEWTPAVRFQPAPDVSS